jgi:drug/metabolite transporter (DMT)-like permease
MTLLDTSRSPRRTHARRRDTEPVPPRWLGPFTVSLAAVGFGLNPYFATKTFEQGVDPVAAASVRVVVLMVILAPWAPRLRGWKREAIFVAAAGAISMVGFAGYFIALDRAPVAAATVVYYTYPIIVLMLSAMVWRRRLRSWEVAVCTLVLVGVALAVGPIGVSSSLLVALAPAIAAPVGWAVYLLVLSGPAAKMPTLPKVFAGSCGGVVVLLPYAMWNTGGRLLPMNSGAVAAMGLLTLCTLAIPAVLVTWGAARAGERATAMIGSFEFAVAVGAGWMLQGDQLSSVQMCGVFLVLASAFYAARHAQSEDRNDTETSPAPDSYRSLEAPRLAPDDVGPRPSSAKHRWNDSGADGNRTHGILLANQVWLSAGMCARRLPLGSPAGSREPPGRPPACADDGRANVRSSL